ncbi:hypothetical protein CDG76_16965 [Nostoc sp. 'Peltigera membranacea cyanobiont' 210A]|uniref:hypothetical protein n=1 Tax=Nostoc sp. 'Peltigera membranacea cyanobiont' 210A TaxID=2014529 RepID=UPI000B95B116|nr:hypothetical protein [Nostoc sp. 'Peltigera membranacea cyanobiont' 210A]OYD93684.1 hypothetical protein CDG76_16965 [Nostoc sp. 'Peltigera membranacea cyanobiont' 210A]
MKITNFINYLLAVEPLLDIIFLFIIFITPILLVNFINFKWLAILLGGICFPVGAILDAFLNCLKPQQFCNSETYETGPIIFGFILGCIYSFITLITSKAIKEIMNRNNR